MAASREAEAAPPTTVTAVPRLRVAVIGLGLAGRYFHVPHVAACALMELTVVMQRSPLSAELAADLAAIAPRARVVNSVNEVLAAADVDAVIVASPDTTHYEVASAALRAGKHVLVDKPMTTTLAQAEALFAQAAAVGVVACMPYQNRRHVNDFRTVEAVLQSGRLGRIVDFESHYDRFRPSVRPIWKELERGALMNLGPHAVDQALRLFGEPSRVWADVRGLRAAAVTDDYFDLHLFYSAVEPQCVPGLFLPPLAKCVLRSTMLAVANEPKFVIHGLLGSFTKAGLDGQEAALCAGGPVLPGGAGWGEEGERLFGTLTTLAADGSLLVERVPTLPGRYMAMYDAFAQAARSATPLEVQEVRPEVAVLLLRVLETAKRSAASGAIELLVSSTPLE